MFITNNNECVLCSMKIPPGGKKYDSMFSHVLREHGKNSMVKCGHYGYVANFPESNSSMSDGKRFGFYFILRIIPQILLLKVVDEEQFHKSLIEIVGSKYNHIDILNTIIREGDHVELLRLFYKSNYKCCICEFVYDSGLPAIEILIRHYVHHIRQ